MAIDRDVIRFVQSGETVTCTYCGTVVHAGVLIHDFYRGLVSAPKYSEPVNLHECMKCLHIKVDNFVIKRVWERKIKEARNGDEA